MTPGDDRLAVAVLGATGMVGQHLVRMLADHPWLRPGALVGPSRSAQPELRGDDAGAGPGAHPSSVGRDPRHRREAPGPLGRRSARAPGSGGNGQRRAVDRRRGGEDSRRAGEDPGGPTSRSPWPPTASPWWTVTVPTSSSAPLRSRSHGRGEQPHPGVRRRVHRQRGAVSGEGGVRGRPARPDGHGPSRGDGSVNGRRFVVKREP